MEQIVDEKLELSGFADAIFKQKYAMEKTDGSKEEWPETAKRVVSNVLGALDYSEGDEEYDKILQYVKERKFMPGGRYLYSAGRPLHQVNNCFLCTVEDSREGWADLLKKAAMVLQTGGGFGVDYSALREYGAPIKKTGGIASGPLPLMQMVNEIGRGVMQGGSRRSALIALLDWDHPDIHDFIHYKDWPSEIRELKEQDFNTFAPMDMTNISINLNDEFFEALNDENHDKHKIAEDVYHDAVKNMLETGEPGFSVNLGNFASEKLRNPCITKENYVLTDSGYKQVKDLLDKFVNVWTGKQWAENVYFEKTKSHVDILNVEFSGNRNIRCDSTHEFFVENWQGKGEQRELLSINKVRADQLEEGDILHVSSPIEVNFTGLDSKGYTDGWIFGDGSISKTGKAELTLCSVESQNCEQYISGTSTITKPDSRGYARMYFPTNSEMKGWNKNDLPEEIFSKEDDYILSFLAGLWDADGNFDESRYSVRLANKSPKFLRDIARLLEQYSIFGNVSKNGHDGRNSKQQWQLVIEQGSVNRFLTIIPTKRCSMKIDYNYMPYRKWNPKVKSVTPDGNDDVYCANVGVEEHSFMCEGIIISNCGEVVSADDSDVCNLGSINLAKIKDIEELEDVIDHASLFLLAGTVYSDVPYEYVKEVRAKNRRIGLGIMGVHEWLLTRGYDYGPCDELGEWLSAYSQSWSPALKWAQKHDLSHPIATRAVAPTGTIGILGETTTSIEPIFCVAYQRRYLTEGNKWKYQYVVDPTAQRLIEDYDINPSDIEDAYQLSYNYERRMEMQAWIQKFVDMGVSSTINLPEAMTSDIDVQLFKESLIKYLPELRGITVYPNNARGGQPLTPIPYETAIDNVGIVFEENVDASCRNGVCGS